MNPRFNANPQQDSELNALLDRNFTSEAKAFAEELQDYADNLSESIKEIEKFNDPSVPGMLYFAWLGGIITNLTLRARMSCPNSGILVECTAAWLDISPRSAEFSELLADLAGASGVAVAITMLKKAMDEITNAACVDAKQELGRIMRINPEKPLS